jgi:hypothetical protein
MTITPYGDIDDLLDKDAPWRVFRSDDPLLLAIRADRYAPVDCETWISTLIEDRRGVTPFTPSESPNWGSWIPFEGKELDAIQDCDHSPCDVKLDKLEGERMGKKSKGDRPSEFLSLILERARAYEKDGTRKPYEFSGGIGEPWSILEGRGLKTPLLRPSRGELGLRILDFKQSRMRPVRQLLDRRTAVSKDGLQASVWIRDVYTDHYFDGWGEWANVRCLPEKKEVDVTLAVSIELDLLKKTDFFSSLAKGSMRDSVRTLSIDYLNEWYFGMLDQAAAKEKKKNAAQPLPSSAKASEKVEAPAHKK